MFAGLVLVKTFLVTIGTGFRRHGQYLIEITLGRMPVAMAIVTGNVFIEMLRELSIGHSARCGLFMAGHTVFGIGASCQKKMRTVAITDDITLNISTPPLSQ